MWFPGATSTPGSFTPNQKYMPGICWEKKEKSSAPVVGLSRIKNFPSAASDNVCEYLFVNSTLLKVTG